MHVLVVNVGSSSLKLRVLDDKDQVVANQDLPAPGPDELLEGLRAFLTDTGPCDAVGHRVVHGGSMFTQPVVLDPGAEHALEGLVDLAPLHNPPAVAAIRAVYSLRPDIPQIACFDTAFHADMPAKAATYAIPRAWRERWDIRRFGFHGLSHAWATRRASQLLGRPPAELRLISAHLGAGASLAAVAFGISVDTTMGFTPMDGLVMATRSGSVDPGLVLWLIRHGGLPAGQVQDALEHDSGLRGLWGGSGDVRPVIAAADSGSPDARLAYDVYVYRIRAAVASMAAAMEGFDGLVFTGGVGTGSPRVRGDTCAGLGFLDVQLDRTRNEPLDGDRIVSPAVSTPAVLVVEAREDIEIAGHVRELLA